MIYLCCPFLVIPNTRRHRCRSGGVRIAPSVKGVPREMIGPYLPPEGSDRGVAGGIDDERPDATRGARVGLRQRRPLTAHPNIERDVPFPGVHVTPIAAGA
jgi:hypothetical protein